MIRTQEDQTALEVLDFLAQMQERLAAFRQSLLLDRRNTALAIVNAVSDIECHQYESGLTIEMWVEAEVAGGDALTWWTDMVSHEGGWLLDGRVSWNGQDVVFELPSLTVPDFQTAQDKVPAMLEELFYAGKQVLNKRLSA